MKVFEDLNIVVTDDFEEGRRVNGKIPVILSEPCEYTAQDLDKIEEDYKVNNVFLNDDEVLVLSLDFSCALVIRKLNSNPTGIVLHGEEKDVVKLLSGLFSQLCFDGIQLQRVVRASKRAVLNIYREIFKTAKVFSVDDKNGTVHSATITMDLDKLSYSSDTNVNLDEFFKLLHPELEVVKVDLVSGITFKGFNTYRHEALEFRFGSVRTMTRSMLVGRKTYPLFYDGQSIGSVELFGRRAKKQLYIELSVPEVFDETKLSHFKDALQTYISSDLNGWTIVLNYNKCDVAVQDEETEVGELGTEDTSEPLVEEVIELELEEDDMPLFLNFTNTLVKVKGHVVVEANRRYGLDGVTGAVVSFEHPAETFALINDLVYGGVGCIFYLQDGKLHRYDTGAHMDSIMEVSREAECHNRENRRFGFLTEGLEDRRRDSVSRRRSRSFHGERNRDTSFYDERRRRFGRD